MKRLICFLMAMLLLLSVAGCTPQETPQETTPPPAAPIINNLFEETGMLAKGQSVTLKADQLSGTIQWTSSDPALATVDASGTVTAQASRGAVTITAAAGEKTQTWNIPLCEETPFGSVSLRSSDGKLTVGVWNGAFQWFDETYMKLMADAGINLIIGLKDMWIWEGDGAPTLDIAEKYGVSIIADLRNWDGETIPEYVDYPALKGFLLYDEPSSPMFQDLAAKKEKFQAVMPEDLLFFVNLFPEACGYESLFGDDYHSGRVDYERFYQDLFLDTVKPAVLSYDGYALQEGGTIRDTYYHNFDIAAHRTKQDGIPFWYTLCSSGHWTTDGRYLTPTDKELRWQMALGMTYGAEALNHYVLASPTEGDDNMLSYAVWEPTAVYDAVKKVNQEYLAWDDIYMSYDWVGTAKVDATGKLPNIMLATLEYDIPLTEAGMLTGAESTEHLLIGVFEKDGENGYMITNAGSVKESEKWKQYAFEMQDAQVKLTLEAGEYQCAAVISQGKITYVPVNKDNTVSISVGAYDGVFVIPIKK